MTSATLHKPTVAAATIAVAWGLATASASAHGPCTCITPANGYPGDPLRVEIKAIRAVFNPTKSQLVYTPLNLRPKHRAGQPTKTLFRSRHPRYQSFRLPRAAPGQYLVAVWDGSEGGAHFTWQAIRLLAKRQAVAPALTRRASRGQGSPWVLVGGAAALALTAAVTLVLIRRRRAASRATLSYKHESRPKPQPPRA